MMPRASIVVFALLLGGCALLASDYDQWSEFQTAVAGMNTTERRARYEELAVLYEQVPGTLTRLQLAYLIGLGAAPDAAKLDAVALLDGVADDHELAPIRDLIRQQQRLRESRAEDRVRLKALRRECDALSGNLGDLRSQGDALRRDIETCQDQLDALKEIERMMSGSDDRLGPTP